MAEPALDVLEDLWQLSYLTPSYVGRACSAAILLAYGMLENSAIAIVVAALFLPFLSQVLAVSFGAYAGDRGLLRKGLSALAASTLACVAAGVVVSLLHGGSVQFSDFRQPLTSLGISSVIGVAAGLASADDAGRRYLIGVAAAVQYAIFPVWVGVCLVRGFPAASIVAQRIGSFSINVVAISLGALAAYAWVGMRRGEAARFRRN